VTSSAVAEGELLSCDDDSMPSALPSVGSALHAVGECRPCAWFWKPQGCANGEACGHCHLCKVGAIKARKKTRSAEKRTDDRDRQRLGVGAPMSPPPLPQGPAAAAEAVLRPHAAEGEERAGATAAAILPCAAVMVSAEEARSEQESVGALYADGVVQELSLGSLLHSTGECRPCAWFWKKQGCANGRTCLHCHLCPKSELRARRKAREKDRRAQATHVLQQTGDDMDGEVQNSFQFPPQDDADDDFLFEAPQKVFIPELCDRVLHGDDVLISVLPIMDDILANKGTCVGRDQCRRLCGPSECTSTRSLACTPPPGLTCSLASAPKLLEQLGTLPQASLTKARSSQRGVGDMGSTTGGSPRAPAHSGFSFASLVFAGA